VSRRQGCCRPYRECATRRPRVPAGQGRARRRRRPTCVQGIAGRPRRTRSTLRRLRRPTCACLARSVLAGGPYPRPAACASFVGGRTLTYEHLGSAGFGVGGAYAVHAVEDKLLAQVRTTDAHHEPITHLAHDESDAGQTKPPERLDLPACPTHPGRSSAMSARLIMVGCGPRRPTVFGVRFRPMGGRAIALRRETDALTSIPPVAVPRTAGSASVRVGRQQPGL
jgi:hypothetical protein